jgi:hypothetical protein
MQQIAQLMLPVEQQTRQLARQAQRGRALRTLPLTQQAMLLMLAAMRLMQLQRLLTQLGSTPRMQLLQLLSV